MEAKPGAQKDRRPDGHRRSVPRLRVFHVRVEPERRALEALGRWPRPHAGDASRLEVIPNWTGRFEKSRFELSENDQEEMRKWLNKAKSTEGNWPIHRRLLIEGHTDANGSFEGNNILSLSRAMHTKRLVVSAGLSAEYITCIAKGDAEVTGVPKLDRRVELRWVPAE